MVKTTRDLWNLGPLKAVCDEISQTAFSGAKFYKSRMVKTIRDLWNLAPLKAVCDEIFDSTMIYLCFLPKMQKGLQK